MPQPILYTIPLRIPLSSLSIASGDKSGYQMMNAKIKLNPVDEIKCK